MMYSASTELFDASEDHARMRGTGILNTSNSYNLQLHSPTVMGKCLTYQFPCGDLGGRRVMRRSGIWIWELRKNLGSIVHCQNECLVVQSLGALEDSSTCLILSIGVI